MNQNKWFIVVAVVALTGGAALLLNRLQAGRVLGEPGLKMVEGLVYDETHTNVVGTNTIDLPIEVLDYRSRPLPVTQAELSWLPGDTTYGRRRYTNDVSGAWFDISVVLMGTDRTSIHKPEVCLEGQGFGVERSDLVAIPISRPYPYELQAMRLVSPERRARMESGEIKTVRALFVYWFVSDRRLTAKHGERMWWMAKDLVSSGVLPRWAYVAYYSIQESDQMDDAFERMKTFIAASVPEFQLVAGPKPDPPRQSASLK